MPHRYRETVIDHCHREVGHQTFVKSLARIQESYVCPEMSKAIRTYLARCVECQTLCPKSHDTQRGQMPVQTQPFHTWGLDLVGPFPHHPKEISTC